MEKPNKFTPSGAYLERSAFSTAGVAADPEVAGLEAGLAARHLGLKQAVREHEDLLEEIQRKRAALVRKDRACDAVLRSFELHLYDLVKKQRTAPLYRRYFEDGLRDVTEANMRTEQPQKVASILQCMDEDANKPETKDLTAKFQPPLTATLADMKTAEKDLAFVEAQADHLREKTIPELEALWTDEYVKLHGELKIKFPRDPARVESYFYAFKKERKKGEPEGEK